MKGKYRENILFSQYSNPLFIEELTLSLEIQLGKQANS